MQSTDPKCCAICQRTESDGVSLNPDGQSGFEFKCPLCGTYTIKGRLAWRLSSSWPPELRKPLSCAARQGYESGQRLEINETNAAEHAERHAKTRVSDNIDRLLLQIAARSERPVGSATFHPDNDFTLIGCYSRAEFVQCIQWIEHEGLAAKFVTPGYGPSLAAKVGKTVQLSLTMTGWNRVQPLSRSGGIPGRCFVAMWFDESMNEVFELGISRAVGDCGFPPPVRIDRKEHNNQITDEIIAAIRDAEFVIADFTGNRGGVYYEAGFARGLGRPVIHCCKDTDFDDRHFDTKLINHIKWSDPADLREKLANRIKATIIPEA